MTTKQKPSIVVSGRIPTDELYQLLELSNQVGLHPRHLFDLVKFAIKATIVSAIHDNHQFSNPSMDVKIRELKKLSSNLNFNRSKLSLAKGLLEEKLESD